MPPPKLKNLPGKRQKDGLISKYASKYVNVEYVKSLLLDPSKLHIVSGLILLAELFLNIFVVQTVSYTEIDWKAYMQECQGFLNGTTNYSLLKGDTGPLVYPAAFVYVYTLFYYLTSSGTNIKLAQYVFIFIYLAQMYLVLRLYTKSRKVPPYVLLITTFTSYRIHSIYVLRLFNDPIAILFAYAAFNLFLDQRWTLGSICFSLGVSVKMNILLFAPAILLLYLTNLGYVKTAIQLAVCAILQAILGAPFLMTYPVEYIKGSFDLGRIFEHKWTVNYRFLSRDIFENKSFHMGLLVLHLTLLVVFCSPCYKFVQSYARLRALQTQLQPQIDRKNAEVKAAANKKAKLKMKSKEKLNEGELTAEQEKFIQAFEKSIQQSTGLSKPLEEKEEEEESSYSIHFDKAIQLPLLPIFLANLIGVACARSLHYQFYVWYFHSLPYLAWFTDFSLTQKFLILGLIEYSWNTYPSTDYSSFVLHSCHIVLLFGIAKKLFKSKTDSEKLKDK